MMAEKTTDRQGGGSGVRGKPDATSKPEEDARALVDQMRSAPAEQIISDLFSLTLNAASIKLGRRDARLFIDLASTVLEQTRPYVSQELAKHVDDALGQLRLGQVTAEQQRVKAKREPEENDLDRSPKPPASAGEPSKSKLWVPGADGVS